jgi:hypothetical protein
MPAYKALKPFDDSPKNCPLLPVINTDVALPTNVTLPRTVRLLVTVTLPEITPPDELNLVFAKSNAAFAWINEELAYWPVAF